MLRRAGSFIWPELRSAACYAREIALVQIRMLVRFHSLSVGFTKWPHDSAMRPSGEKATESTEPECPIKVRIGSPVGTFQSLSVLSALPDSAVRPSGENAT